MQVLHLRQQEAERFAVDALPSAVRRPARRRSVQRRLGENHVDVRITLGTQGRGLDRNTVGVSAASVDECALSVLVTVVSTSVSGHAAVDGGSKTFSSDRYQAEDGHGFGLVKDDPAVEIERFSEEHGHLNLTRSERRYRVGDRLAIIPNHVCSTVNLHDEIYGVRAERVETVWRVAGRGKVH